MKKTIIILLCLALSFGLFSGCGDAVLSDAENSSKVALILMNHTDRYWAALEEGAMKAASEFGVEIVNLSIDAGDDDKLAEQIRSAVSSGCNAVVLAANDTAPVHDALQDAVDAGVKLVYVDSAADIEPAATVATNHKAAGRAAGGRKRDRRNRRTYCKTALSA